MKLAIEYLNARLKRTKLRLLTKKKILKEFKIDNTPWLNEKNTKKQIKYNKLFIVRYKNQLNEKDTKKQIKYTKLFIVRYKNQIKSFMKAIKILKEVKG